ncbi:MAG: diguanylate cyclase [Proteobacteria bacterium]|nr:diguanylate cyclase [Desulfobacula sp.]MBU3953718.1 diguanylate cyclase [Pseudomonadota bacterium]MBU4133214.1 diguanylate cyclase [Pseudomonadota bacterium]
MDDKFYANLLENLYDGVYYVDLTKKITFWNKSAEKITGYSKAEVMGSFCSDGLLRHINDAGDELCEKGCPLTRTLEDGKIRGDDVYLHHKNGHRVPVSVRVSPIFDKQGHIIGAAEIFSDNSKGMRLLQELGKLKNETFSDQLTQVGNRKFADLALSSRFNEMKNFDIQFGILFFDIDEFKKINDTYGHRVGDDVLKMVSQTILNVLRSLDCLCRWGGDEFLVIVPNVDLSTLGFVAEKIRMFIEKTWLEKKGLLLKVTLSVGGTLALKTDTQNSLIERADAQMYLSKKKGRNTVSIV